MITRCYVLLLLLFAGNSFAGIMPSQSRIVYSAQDKSQSLMLVNTNSYPVIVQTWVDHGEGSPDTPGIPFVSIPPVFRLETGDVKGIRLIYNKTLLLPQDRESLFWFNIYEIPPEKKDIKPENSVLVTMNTQIKLFFRPQGITMTSEEAIKKLACQQKTDTVITCHNPSPVYLSMIAAEVNTASGSAIKAKGGDFLMAPKSEKEFSFPATIKSKDQINFSYISELGDHLSYTAWLRPAAS